MEGLWLGCVANSASPHSRYPPFLQSIFGWDNPWSLIMIFITMSASAQTTYVDLIISVRNIVGIVEDDKFENLEARA